MSKINPKQLELLLKLNHEIAHLTHNMYNLLDDVMNKRLETDDAYAAEIKDISTGIISDAMKKNGR
ncbi:MULTISPECIES: hypothetical protein [Oxalobacteraceae]|uniref:Uncharacterized protein n=1 Tax=Herminiimonas aquatilis TaxID=345342 RepID=A0ABW2J5C7_9BURK|nr:hypothetical protein [Janthinobacterium sp. Marseille]